MNNSSKKVHSNQSEMHSQLIEIVQKHKNHQYLKPIAEHSIRAFNSIRDLYDDNADQFILDSGCGVGESTMNIARQNPNCFVLGIDQSLSRIQRQGYDLPSNAQLLRTDCIDFWRLAHEAGWKLNKHYLLYPNPWPKKKHILRRWHAHPVFTVLPLLKGELELRTNWKLYAEEFKLAIELLNYEVRIKELPYTCNPITPFERKYLIAEQSIFQVNVNF